MKAERLPSALPLRVILTTGEPQRLPPFLGSALHGALGRALHRTVCAFPRREACPRCPLEARCAYPALFEPPAPANALLREKGIRDQAPRPLIVAPEPGWTRPSGNPFRLRSGHEVPFRLTLVGPAIAELAIVVVALQATARRGLGLRDADLDGRSNAPAVKERDRAALRLVRVATADGTHVVYDADRDLFVPPPPQDLMLCTPVKGAFPDPLRAEHCSAAQVGGAARNPTLSAESVVLDLVSPLRLKYEGKFATTVTPAIFLAALARRANALSLLCGEGRPAVDESLVASLTASLIADETTLRLVHVRRYSSRQGRRMEWPGLMGRLRWRGAALRDLWPLLRFGEIVQVGKGTSLGFGRYALYEAEG